MIGITTKIISQLVRDSLIWKTLGGFLITLFSFGVFLLKHFFDLQEEVSELKNILQDYQIHQDENFHNSMNTIMKNQELILKQNNIIAEETSYYQYLTLRNFFYVTLAVGAVASFFWLYNMDLFSTGTLESIKETNTIQNRYDTYNIILRPETVSLRNQFRDDINHQINTGNNNLPSYPAAILDGDRIDFIDRSTILQLNNSQTSEQRAELLRNINNFVNSEENLMLLIENSSEEVKKYLKDLLIRASSSEITFEKNFIQYYIYY